MRYKVSVLDVYTDDVRIKILRELDDRYEVTFANSNDREEQLAVAAQADFIITGWSKVDREMIEQARNLRAIHKWGIGVDKIDSQVAKEKGIKVFLTAGVNCIPVSEHALLLIMATLRRLVWVDKSLKNGIWMKSEMRSISQHLTEKRIGIIGMGNIGRNLARLLTGFNCTIYYYDLYRPSIEVEKSLNISYLPFEELLKNSEVVSLHLPLTPETRHMINAKTLALMNKDAIIVNTARGGLIDEKALIEALKNGVIAGAGLDVFEQEPPKSDNELFKLNNVTVSPHSAGATFNNVYRCARHVKRNLNAFLDGGKIPKCDIVVG